jgi:hypothetical protein
VARRGVDFVTFGEEGVISDAAVARHRVYRRGAYVVEERILREAGRSEAMMCVDVNEVKDSLRNGQQSLINCLTRPVEFPASAPPLNSAKWRNTLLVCGNYVTQSAVRMHNVSREESRYCQTN